jgi:hypothetical protein
MPNEIILLVLEFVPLNGLGLSGSQVKERERLKICKMETQARIRSEKNEGNLETLNAMLADAVASVSEYEKQLNALCAVVQRDLAQQSAQEQQCVEKWEEQEIALVTPEHSRYSQVTCMMLHPLRFKRNVMVATGRRMGEAVCKVFKRIHPGDGCDVENGIRFTSLPNAIQQLRAAKEFFVGQQLVKADSIRKIHQQYLASAGKLQSNLHNLTIAFLWRC